MASKNNKKKKSSYNFVPQPKKDLAEKKDDEVKETVEETTATVSKVKADKKDAVSKKDSIKKADDKKKQKKEKKISRIKGKFKEVGSELKKVSWPTFRKVLKKTGIVIGVVAFFTLILFGIDRLASLLYTLLANSIG